MAPAAVAPATVASTLVKPTPQPIPAASASAPILPDLQSRPRLMKAVVKVVDIALGLASRLPANAFSEWLSGALLLVRRTLVPTCGGVGPAASTGEGGAGCGPGSGTAIPNTIKVDVNRAPALTYTAERWIKPSSDGQGDRYRRPGALFTLAATDPDGGDATVGVSAPDADPDPYIHRPAADVAQPYWQGFTFRILDDGREGVDATLYATDGIDTSTVKHWVTRQGPEQGTKTPPSAPTLTISDRDPVTGSYLITPTAADGVTLAVTSNAPAFGSLVANGDGSYTYNPTAERMGDADTVRFTATDGAGSTSSSSVRFTVLPGKDPATAVPVLSGSAEQDPYVSLIFGVSDRQTGAVTITPVLAPAIRGKGVAASVIDGPSHGTLRRSGTGFTYTPTDLRNVGATDTIQFEFNDGKDTVILPLYADITVTDVNHPPVLQLTTSTRDYYTGYRVVDITPLAVDPDGEPIVLDVAGSLLRTTKQGVLYQMPLGEIYYREPRYGVNGDTFHYQIAKGVRSGTPADITITATDSRGLTTTVTTTIVVP